MGDKKKKKDEEEEDLRLEFLFNYFAKSYKLKQEKWTKMLYTDEYSKPLMNFLNKPNEMKMYMTMNQSGLFCCFKEYNLQIKTKYTFFQKKHPDVVTMENIRTLIFMGDMAGKPMEELSILLTGICMPVLSNPENHRGWPKVVAEDVVQHLRAFKNIVDQVRGAMKSQTVLPLPQGFSSVHLAVGAFNDSRGEKCDLTLKSNIENAVIKWASICREILKQSSKAAFAGGAHPTPSKEVEFWFHRLKNVEYIYDQLRDPRVKKMGEYLELTRSTYSKTFKTLFKNIVAGVVEARDIHIYLKPLIPHIQRFEESDFLDNENYIKPLIHCIGLIWANSRYYAFSEKIVVLLKEISNMLIEAVIKQLDPSSIFQGEPEEIFAKVDKSIQLLELFMDSFEYVRKNLQKYYTNPNIDYQPWTFHRRTVFQRLLEFTDRLRLVRTILSTNMEFTKLEKVEFGGLKGRLLSIKCESAFEDFNRIYNVFSNVQYDVLDIEDVNIYKDYDLFREKCDDLDRRLVAIFGQAFDDCYSLEAIFKLRNIIGNLTERPLLRDEVVSRYPKIMELLNDEVDMVKIIYDQSMSQGFPLSNHTPPTAGSILWLIRLRDRILKPYEELKIVEHPMLQGSKAKYLFKKIEQMLSIIRAKECNLLETWIASLPEVININMSKFQLCRDEVKNDLSVNFGNEILAVLREMRYLKTIEGLDLPDNASELYSKAEFLYKSLQRFKRIVEYYNHLKNDCTEVEFNIISDEMVTIDKLLEPAMNKYIWFENDVEVVENMYLAVKALYDRVSQAQHNIHQLRHAMREWAKLPLYERKEGRKEHLLFTEDRVERLRLRFEAIKHNSDELKTVMEKNYELYFNIPEVRAKEQKEVVEVPPQPPPTEETKGKKGKGRGKGKKGKKDKKPPPSPEETGGETGPDSPKDAVDLSYKWEPYIKFVDKTIRDILLYAVKISQSLFMDEMGDTVEITPFLEVVVELHPPFISFEPCLDTDPGFLSYIKGLLEDIYNMGNYMERADPSDHSHYYPDLINDNMCQENCQEIISRIKLAINQALDYVKIYDDYEALWIEDRQAFLREFLLYSRELSEEEREGLRDENAVHPQLNEPSTEDFKQQIDDYDALYKKIEATPTEKLLQGGWLRLDLRPVRQGILNTIRKWGNLFKNHLFNHVIQSLNDLESFCLEAMAAMSVTIAEDDYSGLLNIMGYLFKVKEMMNATDVMFGPLKEIMELLQTYGVEFPEEIYVKLQEVPDKWNQCKKLFIAKSDTTRAMLIPFSNATLRRTLHYTDIPFHILVDVNLKHKLI